LPEETEVKGKDMDKIHIEKLDLYYGDFQALKKINLNIKANEVTAFIGHQVAEIYAFKMPEPNE